MIIMIDRGKFVKFVTNSLPYTLEEIGIMLKELFLVFVGLAVTLSEDVDGLMVMLTGNLVDIEPICDLD